MRVFLSVAVLTLLFPCLTFAQKKEKKKPGHAAANELVLEKDVPLNLGPDSPCDRGNLLTELKQLLAGEGFTIIDSVKASTLAIEEFEEWPKILEAAGLEKGKAALDSRTESKKIYQTLSVKNYTCLDTCHNYEIGVYIFPRNASTKKTITFSLPSKSPYRISDVILSLIKRE